MLLFQLMFNLDSRRIYGAHYSALQASRKYSRCLRPSVRRLCFRMMTCNITSLRTFHLDVALWWKTWFEIAEYDVYSKMEQLKCDKIYEGKIISVSKDITAKGWTICLLKVLYSDYYSIINPCVSMMKKLIINLILSFN